MGQKVNPHGFRVGIMKDWDSRWVAKKDQFADYLVEDNQIRKFLKNKLFQASVSRIEIERAANKTSVTIHTAKPGVVIGKGGTGIEQLKAALAKEIGKTVALNIVEVKRPDLDAQLIAENVAGQLERRTSFRRAMKQSIGRSMKAGLKGIKIMCSGRLGGAEIARREQYHEGSIPLQPIRADIDYGFAEANTTYGKIGVKVWAYKGEILTDPLKERAKGIAEGKKPEGGRRNVNAKKNQA